MAREGLASLGRRLRERGLRAELATAALGGATAIHAARLARTRRRPPPATPVAALIDLFVAGGAVPRALAPDLDELSALGLLEGRDSIRATAALLPHRGALLCCAWDRLPDDSSFHLVGALPRRRLGRWLDLGCGCGFAALSAPRAAAQIRATDIDRRSVELARLGAALSGRGSELDIAVADLFAGATGRFDLITFNAPIEGAEALLARFWAEAPDHLAPGGEVLVHGHLPPPDLHGELVVARYTPPEHRPAFAVARWRPGGEPARREIAVTLAPGAPHLARQQMD